ncbi:hypothetical protein J19TS2_34970 [Cohnella xylanilytica]|uniref:Gamma-glutamylcyclotransferase n=1 Tax=Cohnella xylanilytica TaxID=557555 RepID=A0A841UAP4_9BACL|nr:gamma-glutamylcyclotransferase family protein [Cohnella xylanilytica]MBB6695214.1 gamma-glutamylcyclotransferase [Cohnella xylanilytica]GIO13942.1 hypothetical protein J19TS2_34970 [Cohnella xylanilytica]
MNLFVYGTLLPQFKQHGLIRAYVKPGARPGRVRGRLVDVGEYPALVPGRLAPEGFVRGIWFDIDREGLAVADEYEQFAGIEEDNDYERVWIADADDPSLRGWTYAWSDARGRPYEAGEWWPDIRQAKLEGNA